ncbi:MAG: type IV pilus secretin PilQ [Gammaproteobacteria bacterium]|nr:type IV pilus secretin PilQ [Gammaproteobacteria bacterium]MBU2676187.1 type IV pilus secretin PilQ [Gammaproteobacteria bacterium]NNC57440.1 type IV pilus secretin PilQ [Woeseiaceae bacterium]NNL49923.1 type IV pilus secretin PilQ [Woeseiaceae bacterium]
MLKIKPTVGHRTLVIKLAALAQAALLLFWGATASAQEGNRLQDIQVQSLPGQRVELRLVMSETAPEPLAFTIENPARIALDLPETTLGLSSRRRDVNLGPLDTVLTAEANGRTRVVLNLGTMVEYETRRSGNTVIVTLGGGDNYSAGTTQFASAPASDTRSYAAPGSRSISSVDFRRTRDGGGRVIVNLTDPSTPVDIRQEGGRVVAVFKDTSLPAELMRRLDVMDFATPVTTVDTLRTNLDARIVISADGKYEQLAYQSDNEFTIEINPAAEQGADESSLFSEEKEYEGQRLTLNFQDIETRAVLQLLAETSGKNIVVSDTVQGNVTLRLRNVPWDQALDIVMTTKGLDMRQNGNVIMVAPAEEISARETADLEAKLAISELEPLYSEFLQVNYAKATDLAMLITAESGGNPMLSERGSVGVDDRTNTLLVQDTAERLQSIRRLVRTLDIPIKQVLIESRIVVVSDDFSRDLGVRLGVTAFNESNTGLTTITGTGTGTDTMINSALDNLADPANGTVFPIQLPTLNNRYNVALPIGEAAGRFSLAVLENDYLVDLELTAMEAEGRGEIVSTPRVITANQKQATIKQGVEIPYQQSASSGATTIQFKEAVLELVVTPQITPDNNIIMDLLVSKDNVGEIISTGGLGGTVPSIDTRSVETQVLVANGQTVVLGGIYETERRETINKVPFLGDIPFAGAMFRSKQRTDNKAELLIFVTPRILEEGSTVY